MRVPLLCALNFAVLTGGMTATASDLSRPLGEPQLRAPDPALAGRLLDHPGRRQPERLHRAWSTASWARRPGERVLVSSASSAGPTSWSSIGSELEVPDDGWLFAGSALLLEPATAYELRLTLEDPDGGKATRTLPASTRSEPLVSNTARVRHVVPGIGRRHGNRARSLSGPGSRPEGRGSRRPVPAGSRGLRGNLDDQPERHARPADRLARPGAGTAIIDAQGHREHAPGQAIAASGSHDVWFEDLTIRNAIYGVVFHDAARIVMRHCHIRRVAYGLTATRNTQGTAADHFIADNLIEGPSTWPRTKGIEDARGIQISGQGHVVCYNRIRGFADAIDTFPSRRCAAIDFHNNDLSELTDDGIEMDYSERNTRCFHQPADQRLPGNLDAAGLRRPGLRLPQRDGQRGRRAIQAA